MMKKFAVLTLAVSFLSASLPFSARAADIVSPKADLYISVTKRNDLRSFQLCSKAKKECKTLGFKGEYTVQELKSARAKLQLLAAGKTALIAGAAAVSALGSAAVFSLLPVVVDLGVASWTIVATTSAGTVLYAISSLGPIPSLKQQFVLRSEVIDDEQVNLSSADDEKMTAIAKVLAKALDQAE